MNWNEINELMLVKAKDKNGADRVGYLTKPLGTLQDINGVTREVDIATIRRYTGCKDIKGRLIFEGDTVIDRSWGDYYEGVVNWSRLFCGWRIGERAMYDSLSGNDGYEKWVLV